jgi:hypothetical protein
MFTIHIYMEMSEVNSLCSYMQNCHIFSFTSLEKRRREQNTDSISGVGASEGGRRWGKGMDGD